MTIAILNTGSDGSHLELQGRVLDAVRFFGRGGQRRPDRPVCRRGRRRSLGGGSRHDVIRMAFSGPDYSATLVDAVSYAWSRGAPLVAERVTGARPLPPIWPAATRE